MIISRTKRAFKVKAFFLVSRVLVFRLKKQTSKNVEQPLRDIEYSMNMVLDTRFHIWFIMILYYKMRQILMRQLFYYKMRQKFTTKSVRFFITKHDIYYKMERLLQIATVHRTPPVATFVLRWTLASSLGLNMFFVELWFRLLQQF